MLLLYYSIMLDGHFWNNWEASDMEPSHCFIKKYQLGVWDGWEGDGDLSFRLPVKETALSSEDWKECVLLCKPLPLVTLSDLQGLLESRLEMQWPFSEVSALTGTSSKALQALGLVMQSQVLKDSLQTLLLPATGTCHDPLFDSWNPD